MSSQARVNHFSVDLRRLTILIGAAIAFFGVSLLAIIAYAGWSANQTATEIERTLLENALNQSIARALNEQKSVAWWDDPVVKITDKVLDMEFTDANFGVFLTETYAHDEVYILNAKDQPIYAFADAKSLDPQAFNQRLPALGAVIAEIRQDDRSKLAVRPDMVSEFERSLPGSDRSASSELGWAHHLGGRTPRRRRRHDHRARTSTRTSSRGRPTCSSASPISTRPSSTTSATRCCCRTCR